MSIRRHNGTVIAVHVCRPQANGRARHFNICHPEHSAEHLAAKSEEMARGADDDLRKYVTSGRFTFDGLKAMTGMSSPQIKAACRRLGLPVPQKATPDRSAEFKARKNKPRGRAG